MGSGYHMPTEDTDKAASDADKSARERVHELFHQAGRARSIITMPGCEQPVFTPDPMVKFLEEQVAKLETRLRASEAHCRRYAVACGMFRSEAARVMGLLIQAVHNGGEVDAGAVKDVNAAVKVGFDKADALINPVATEVVK